jgi:hypothetical protein
VRINASDLPDVLSGIFFAARLDTPQLQVELICPSGNADAPGKRFRAFYLFRFGCSRCERALHGRIYPQLCSVTKGILFRLTFRQLLRFHDARICLRFQVIRRQKHGLIPLSHAVLISWGTNCYRTNPRD